MGSVIFWILMGLALILFIAFIFPVKVRLKFAGGLEKIEVRLCIFRKVVYTYKKSFKDGEEAEEAGSEKSEKDSEKKSDKDSKKESSETVTPEYVAAPRRKTEAMAAPSEKKSETPADEKPAETPAAENSDPQPLAEAKPQAVENATSEKESSSSEKKESSQEPEKKESEKTSKLESPKTEDSSETGSKADEKPKKEKKPKKKLTKLQFWGILLSPEIDGLVWKFFKSLVASFFRIFRFHLEGFVDGIHMSNYAIMGYIAGANGVLQGFPYIGNFDFRMDWTGEKELHGEGSLSVYLSICKFFCLLLLLLVYAAVVFVRFWGMRRRVLSNPESLELGFIRRKIVKMITEDD